MQELVAPTDLAAASTAARPFVDGLLFALANGLHCAGMCGPFAACSGQGGAAGVFAWHGGRFVTYATAGAAAGGLGAAAAATAGADTSAGGGTGATVSFALAGLLVLSAAGLDKRLFRTRGLGRFVTSAAAHVRGLPMTVRAGTLGALTAFLPCGLLWAALAAAAAGGSVTAGVVTMAGFTVGSMLPLLLMQGNVHWLRARLGARGLQWSARGLMLLTALMMIWRGAAALASETGSSCCEH